jgi:hypothetical protein
MCARDVHHQWTTDAYYQVSALFRETRHHPRRTARLVRHSRSDLRVRAGRGVFSWAGTACLFLGSPGSSRYPATPPPLPSPFHGSRLDCRTRPPGAGDPSPGRRVAINGRAHDHGNAGFRHGPVHAVAGPDARPGIVRRLLDGTHASSQCLSRRERREHRPGLRRHPGVSWACVVEALLTAAEPARAPYGPGCRGPATHCGAATPQPPMPCSPGLRTWTRTRPPQCHRPCLRGRGRGFPGAGQGAGSPADPVLRGGDRPGASVRATEPFPGSRAARRGDAPPRRLAPRARRHP